MKQKTVLARMLGLLLVLAMCMGCLVAFASCKGKNANETPTQPTSTREPAVTPDDPESEEARLKPEKKDFGADSADGEYEYRMLVTRDTYYQHTYVYDDDDSPKEVCDSALWYRQQRMYEEFNIVLSMEVMWGGSYDALSNNVTAGNADFCQVAMLSAGDSMSAAVNGLLMNLNSMPEFNLEASYWDQRIQEEYAINDYLFTLEGDFNFIDEFFTYVVIYNDTAYNSLQYYDKYGTPYQLADQHKWTYETMMKMVADASYEIDGNSTLDENDFWGAVSEVAAPYIFFLGSGLKYITNDGGTLKFDAAENQNLWETNYNALEKIISMGANKDIILADRDISDTANLWTIASNIFSQNRALFCTTALSAVMRLMDMKDDYGILPVPAYTEDQDGYYCKVSGGHAPLSIPRSVANPSKAALASEYLSYYSRYDGGDSLYYAFYDLLAYARLCRKPEDKMMLELVFASKTYDIDDVAGLSGISGKVYDMVNTKNYTTLSSDLGAIQSSIESAVQKFTVDVINKCPNP